MKDSIPPLVTKTLWAVVNETFGEDEALERLFILHGDAIQEVPVPEPSAFGVRAVIKRSGLTASSVALLQPGREFLLIAIPGKVYSLIREHHDNPDIAEAWSIRPAKSNDALAKAIELSGMSSMNTPSMN